MIIRRTHLYPQALRSSRVQTDLTIIHNPEKRVELPRGKSEKKTAFYTYVLCIILY